MLFAAFSELFCRCGGRFDRLGLVAIEEGDHLSAGAGLLDAEVGIVDAGGDAVLQGPQDGLVVVLVGILHVLEGALRGLGLGLAESVPEKAVLVVDLVLKYVLVKQELKHL